MSSIKSLVNKLNPNCKKALEKAASLCLVRTHYNIELEHWLLALITDKASTMSQILQQAGLDIDSIVEDINFSLESYDTGNDQTPAISQRVLDLINEAWLIGSLEFSSTEIHSGLLLCAMSHNTVLKQVAHSISEDFDKLTPEATKNLMQNVLRSEPSETPAPTTSKAEKTAPKGKKSVADHISTATGEEAQPGIPSQFECPNLDQFTTNLNEQAKSGKIDPVIGRENEIRQMVDVLSRRRQNNVILTGEPGVGKTAIVEGLARLIVEQDVPDNLKDVVIHSLDLGLLQAGAGVKGEFENRLKNLIDEVKSAPYPIVMFIDEAHTLIGAGGQAGQGDAANMLKPALARGELRSIAATTWSEYKQYFEKDAALTRRFQVVKIEEPETEVAVQMLRSLCKSFEKHHNVKVLDSAVRQATTLSERYITGRQLPDKSISVMDTACARVSGKQTTTPGQVEHTKKLLKQLEIEQDKLIKEENRGFDHSERLKDLKKEIKTHQETINKLTKQWQAEKDCVADIIKQSHTLDELSNEQKNAAALKAAKTALEKAMAKLDRLQGDNPLIQAYVDDQAVAEVIADWTGIPVGKMMKDQISQVLNLADHLKQRITGQDHALEQIGATVRTSGAKLADPGKPNGIFLFVGPSGIGKTETALALADSLYGSEENMTVINMSEFKEEHKVSMLAGAPPGYVGYGEGGVLTEAVRRKPYSLILLDEIEKAHPGIQDVFYQVFDKGMLKDGQGRDIDFKNTLIILTTNACSDLISELCSDPENLPNPKELNDKLKEELSKTFKPAFLGRLSIIPYYPLHADALRQVIQLKLKKIIDRIQDQHKVKLMVTKPVIEEILSRCQHNEIGARQIDNILTQTVLPELSELFLANIVNDKPLTDIEVKLNKDKSFKYLQKRPKKTS